MAKFYGEIGYAIPKETSPGINVEEIVIKNYYIDIIKNGRSLQNTGSVNDGISINNSFSIIANPYATENYFFMRYITFNGVKWKITNVDVQTPRLIITVGGVYNGK